VTAVVGGLALAALWWLRARAEAPVRVEREPNDSAARANRIATEMPVAGWLGRRRSPTEPDVDVFRVARPATGAIAVELAAVPNIDVTITVRDTGGRVVAQIDEQPLGGDERLGPRTVDGDVTIEVGQVMTTPLPVENVSDRYRLIVHAPAPDRGHEREPNGDASDATPIGAESPVRGRLESRTDVDALRWTGPSGTVVVEVTAPPQPPISWRGPDGTDRSVGRATVTLSTDAVVTLRRRDRDAPKGAIAAADASWSVTITPAR
jgi:hypothetical protein